MRIMKFNILRTTAAFALATMLQSGTAFGQSSLLNTQKHHAVMQNDLISYNKVIPKIMNVVDSSLIADQLKTIEAEFPAAELYSDDWDNKWVKTFSENAIPDTFAIDVSDYCIPVPGYKTSDYGWRRYRMHKGVDLKLQTGDTVRAAFSGKVRKTAYEARGYGYYVVMRHPNGLETVYGHLSKILVKPNQIIKVGDPIALGGSTGRSTGPHLHFETRFLGMALNPNDIFDFVIKVPHTDTYVFTKKKQQKSSGSYASYRIKSGDTLSSIAAKHGTSVSQLCRLNGISSKKILRIGTVLRVR